MLNEIADQYKNSLFNELSTIGKCLSSEKRLEILILLTHGSKNVENIAQTTGMSIANTSRHLKILREGRLVSTEKDGNYVVYTLATPKVAELVYMLRDVGEEQLSEMQKIQQDFDESHSKIYTLDLEEAYMKMENEEIILVDLRPEDEYHSGHMDNAQNIPINVLEERLDELPKNSEIIVYCRGHLCAYANLATDYLNNRGYKTYSLNQSYYDWKKHKQEV